VQKGLDWLATLEPRARVSFIYNIHLITVNVIPGRNSNVDDPYEAYEAGWREAALRQIGPYPPGRAGYQQYVTALQQQRQTNSAYLAFFTKYQLQHFAYAIGEKVVLHYDNDGWGPNSIHNVFAHESCHIFGAADEYGNCACGEVSGYLHVPNGNCVNCFPSGIGQAECVMNRNALQMCQFTRRQIGWDESLFPRVGQDIPGTLLQRTCSIDLC
jgi:hypothetical protein